MAAAISDQVQINNGPSIRQTGKYTPTRKPKYMQSPQLSTIRGRVDDAFTKWDLKLAARLIHDYTREQSQSTRPWGGEKSPSPEAIRTASWILKYGEQYLSKIICTPETGRTLILQATESALVGFSVFDRLKSVNEVCHPKGNQWIVDQLIAASKKRAKLASQVSDANPHVGDSKSIQHSEKNTIFAVPNLPTRKLPRFMIPLRLKITIPYLFLALVLAFVGAQLISNLLFETLEERFTNQLIEAGKLAMDRMVTEESDRLATLRVIANTDGISDAIIGRNSERLRNIIFPLALNTTEDAIEILDLESTSLLSLRHQSGGKLEDYIFTSGDSVYQGWPFISRTVDDNSNTLNDKQAGIVDAPWGRYFYVAGPVFDSTGQRIGTILVGKSLESLAIEFRQDILAQISFYDTSGKPLASSFPRAQFNFSEPVRDQIQSVMNSQAPASLVRTLPFETVTYNEIVGQWKARTDTTLGLIGVALPRTFLVQPTQNTRVQILVLIGLGLVLIISIGLYLSRLLTQPLLQLVRAYAKVGQGNLNIKVNPTGNDEIAVLANGFNHMMKGLREASERQFREVELNQRLRHERELNEMKSRFVSMVSHEFRTPLASILSSAEFIKTFGNTAAPTKRDKHFHRIESSISNMTQLLEDVLFIGRSEAGRLEYNPATFEITSFCKELADEIQMNAGSRHSIDFTIAGERQTIYADRKLLRLALSNLLSNAVKYSPEGGKVLFGLECSEETTTFLVKDSGIGIPEADQKHLFETFHRASNVATISGTGLGLYITKMAVELHGGKIGFRSQIGLGTKFKIIIPVREKGEAKK